MNNPPPQLFDRITDVKPMDTFGALVATSLVKGILYDFQEHLVSVGFDATALETEVRNFAESRRLDLSQGDTRFWDSMLSGINDFYQRPTSPPEKPTEIPRSTLAKLEDTLPPYKAGRDRRVQFEPDGTIIYPEHDSPWNDEPNEINGYQRDPNNPFRFVPLWKECLLRRGIAVRYAQCGCIDVIMRCGHPKCAKFGDRVSHTDCADCLLRIQEPNDELQKLP
jgi:hypothetical protein